MKPGLEKYLHLLEEKLERGKRHFWKNADYEFLSEDIHKKTGISVSNSTLKRVFRKTNIGENYQPHESTFLALANYLGYENWEHFEKHLKETRSINWQGPSIKKNDKGSLLKIAGTVVLLASAATLLVLYGIPGSDTARGKPYFNADDTVITAPGTVRFTYDTGENPSGDTFMIFPSHYHRDILTQRKGEYLYTYTVPGYYNCLLSKNGQEIARKNILVVSNGWRSAVVSNNDYFPVKLNFYSSGAGKMYVNPEELKAIDSSLFKKQFFLEFKEVKNYGISGDHLKFETRVKNVTEEGGRGCRKITIDLLGKKGRIRLDFFHNECNLDSARFILGRLKKSLKYADAPGFWQNLSDWHKILIETSDRQVKIRFDNTVAYESTYMSEVGHIYTVIFGFEGCGSIDYIHIADMEKGLNYLEDFN